ncbi:MAG: RDD family protein [Flavobacteriales bacterium]|nr:RDD family protein [Flavobacteriales bacterium]
MENIYIHTTQNVRIDQELATLGDRTLAYLIDTLIMIVWLLIMIEFRDSFGSMYNLDAEIVWLFVLLLPMALYHLLFEIFANGQSVGKMVMKIRVIRTDGAQPTLGNYLIRWLMRIVEFMLFRGLALLAFLILGKGQRLGDLFAGTTVVRLRRRVTLQDTVIADTDKSYKPTYPQAQYLSHRDIEVIKETLAFYQKTKNYLVLAEAFVKVQEVLDIDDKTIPQIEFLETVVKDFNYFRAKEIWETNK